jgi:hypothetical protein
MPAGFSRSFGLANVRTIERDFVAHGMALPEGLAGYAMLFNMLHDEQPLELLREAFRVLRIGGRIGIIHWIPSADTPRGPDLSIRPRAEQCREWPWEAGFELRIPSVELPPYHYGVVGLKARPDPTRLTMSNQ